MNKYFKKKVSRKVTLLCFCPTAAAVTAFTIINKMQDTVSGSRVHKKELFSLFLQWLLLLKVHITVWWKRSSICWLCYSQDMTNRLIWIIPKITGQLQLMTNIRAPWPALSSNYFQYLLLRSTHRYPMKYSGSYLAISFVSKREIVSFHIDLNVLGKQC